MDLVCLCYRYETIPRSAWQYLRRVEFRCVQLIGVYFYSSPLPDFVRVPHSFLTTMLGKQDVEAGDDYQSTEHEREALLSTAESSTMDPDVLPPKSKPSHILQRKFSIPYLFLSFVAGSIACLTVQFLCGSTSCFSGQPSTSIHNTGSTNSNNEAMLAPPYVGSTVRHPFPPPSPTNAVPTLFPTDVGYAGGTPTGAEPAIIATAPSYPIHSGAAQLIEPGTLGKNKKGSHGFDIFRKWGNLSPWYSVDRTTFGLNSGPETPESCRVTGLHLLHRHGARYPTAWCKFFARRVSLTL
jgi:hypothetical protein